MAMYVQPGSVYAPQTYPITTYPAPIVPITGGAQLAPLGFVGSLLGQLAGPVGQTIGGLFGQPQLGWQPGQVQPFQAAPMLAAQWPYSGIVPPQIAGHLPFQSAPLATPVA
jgi:hypothetical protein